MRNCRLLYVCALTVFCGAALAATNPWPARTLSDLKQIHHIISQYEPYQFTHIKAPYAAWINQGYFRAKRSAAHASSLASYRKVLNDYVNGFRIEHIYLSFPLSQSKSQNSSNKSSASDNASIRSFGRNGAWIRLPSFKSDDNKQLRLSLQQVNNRISSLRNKRNIIIDLRNNPGGQATYARSLITNLYGKPYLSSLGNQFIWNKKWSSIDVLSPRLIATISLFANDDPTIPPEIKAYQNKQKSFTLSYWPAYQYKQSSKHVEVKNPTQAHIFLLTNKYCYSMCYQITRTWLSLPNTILIGQQPNTMGLVTNPIIYPITKYVKLHLASRIITSPTTAFNKPLLPKYIYPGDINDNIAVQAWVRSLIKQPKAH